MIIIPIIVWKSRKKNNVRISTEYDPNIKFADILANTPKKEQVDALRTEFDSMIVFLREGYDKQNRELLERLTSIAEKNEKEVKEKMVEQVQKLLQNEGAVSREEIDRIVERLDRIQVDDTDSAKIEVIGKLFDSTNQGVINWKCNLLKLLRNGLAPDIDNEKLASASIPLGKYQVFLKKLVNMDIVKEEKIDSFSLNEKYDWIYSYIEKPSWLKDQIEHSKVVKKEKEYQKWLRNNLEKIEIGLLKEEKEVKMKGTGIIDFLCRDMDGKPVGLELKYPKASKRDVKQLIAYADEFRLRVDGQNFRGMMIAPKIVQELKDSLSEFNLEWRELPFDDDSGESVNSKIEDDKISNNESANTGWCTNGHPYYGKIEYCTECGVEIGWASKDVLDSFRKE